MNALTVIVPLLPPTVNHLYVAVPRTRKGGGRYMGKELSPAAVLFRDMAMHEAREVARLTGWQLPEGRLKIALKLTFGDLRNQDIDNRAKAGIDAVALALGFDDSRIDRVVIERVGYEKGRPLCEIILAPFDGRRLVSAGDCDE